MDKLTGSRLLIRSRFKGYMAMFLLELEDSSRSLTN